MRSFFNRFSWDLAGFSVSFLCAIHCAALPLLVTVTTFAGLTLLQNQILEACIIGVSAVLGMMSLLPGYLRKHRKMNALLWLAIGFLLIGLGRSVATPVWEPLVVPAGALAIAFAHYANWKLCRHCEKRSS